MKIENHQLITDSGAIELPRLPRDTAVRVWAVPAAYRGNGLFVTTDPSEVPACDHGAPIFESTLPAHPDSVAAEQEAALIKRFDGAIQRHLDAAAQAKGYDGIVSACSYAGAPNPFQIEGQAFVQWRGDVWAKCYQVMEEVQGGQRQAPSITDLIAELPELVLP